MVGFLRNSRVPALDINRGLTVAKVVHINNLVKHLRVHVHLALHHEEGSAVVLLEAHSLELSELHLEHLLGASLQHF